MQPQFALSQLEQAFSEKHRYQCSTEGEIRIGIFGNRFPEVLLQAAGCRTVDVKAIPDEELHDHHPGIATLIEPFLDDYSKAFLHRLFSGRFHALSAVFFCRQDASALVAYQYAHEYVRQGRCEDVDALPRLLLWNAEFGDTEAVHRFNLCQVQKLWQALADFGVTEPVEEALRDALGVRAEQLSLLRFLQEELTLDSPRLSGTEALCWRQAGRYMSASQHLSALRGVVESLPSRQGQCGHRFGLFGSSTDAVSVYQVIDRHGSLVCDQQPIAEGWPGPDHGATASVDDILRSIETDLMVSRGRSSVETLTALVAQYQQARCQTVIIQLDEHDDTYGWDIPLLTEMLAECGIQTLHLGFRALRPDDAWLTQAGNHIQQAVEASHL